MMRVREIQNRLVLQRNSVQNRLNGIRKLRIHDHKTIFCFENSNGSAFVGVTRDISSYIFQITTGKRHWWEKHSLRSAGHEIRSKGEPETCHTRFEKKIFAVHLRKFSSNLQIKTTLQFLLFFYFYQNFNDAEKFCTLLPSYFIIQYFL